MPSISATPRSEWLGKLADALAGAKQLANGARIPQVVPLIGGQGVGELVLGQAPNEINEWSYGNSPLQVSGGGTGSYVPQIKQDRRQSLADALLLLGPTAKYASKAPAAAREALSDFVSHSSGPAGQFGAIGSRAPAAISDAERAKRMADMGMERGWYRAGEKIGPDGRRNGPMFTQDAEEAAGYLRGFERRTGREGDLREYAIPADRFLNADKSYPSRLAHDVANIIDSPYYGKDGAFLAKQMRTYGPDERINGGTIWQALESRFGNDGAAEVVDKLNAFNGAKGFTAPGEAYVFKSAPVRDANRAAFDPEMKRVDNIYGFATPGTIAGSGLLGMLGLEALRRKWANE